MTISQLAASASITVEAVRYYQRRGLLKVPRRPDGHIRRYEASDVSRLRFIKRAQSLGFSLDEVQSLLALDDGQTCIAARDIAQRKLVEVRERVRTLKTLEAALDRLVHECAVSRRKVRCPLIDALMKDESIV